MHPLGNRMTPRRAAVRGGRSLTAVRGPVSSAPQPHRPKPAAHRVRSFSTDHLARLVTQELWSRNVLTDDIDGTEAASTIEFLRQILEPYLAAASPSDVTPPAVPCPRRSCHQPDAPRPESGHPGMGCQERLRGVRARPHSRLHRGGFPQQALIRPDNHPETSGTPLRTVRKSETATAHQARDGAR